MASSSFSLLPFTILILLLQLTPGALGCFTSIISFGDSLIDTGNYLLSLHGKPDPVGNFPYGETFFHRTTGRCSDGRIILDFIAEAMGLPYVPPFLGGESSGDNFRHGVNFAVGGATAMRSGFFWERGFELSTNYSLDVQVEWFSRLLPSLCNNDVSDCDEILSKSLFIVGEFGGNDYFVPFLQGSKLDESFTLVPRVIDAISSAINDLIHLGAKTLVVPGCIPIGCVSCALTEVQNSEREDYDPQTGCSNFVNSLLEYHNQKLQQELNHLRKRHPSATIVYGDYYNAIMRIFRNPQHFGFEEPYLSACCGGGGPYNYNSSALCGTRDASVCSDPSRFINWDGYHFTEAANIVIASALIRGPYAIPQISNACHRGPQYPFRLSMLTSCNPDMSSWLHIDS